MGDDFIIALAMEWWRCGLDSNSKATRQRLDECVDHYAKTYAIVDPQRIADLQNRAWDRVPAWRKEKANA